MGVSEPRKEADCPQGSSRTLKLQSHIHSPTTIVIFLLNQAALTGTRQSNSVPTACHRELAVALGLSGPSHSCDSRGHGRLTVAVGEAGSRSGDSTDHRLSGAALSCRPCWVLYPHHFTLISQKSIQI